MLKELKYYILVCSVLLIESCSNTKYLPAGEALYIGAEVNVKSDSLKKRQEKTLATELKRLTLPKPNSAFIGLRPKLLAYNIAGTPKKSKGLRNWLKYKVGETPVLAGYLSLQNNVLILKNRLENKGFFNASVTGDTISLKHKVKAVYKANTGPRFFIRSVGFTTDSSKIGKEIVATEVSSLLKPGNPYDLEIIKSERIRIDRSLKDIGYYYFVPDNLLVRVDSSIGYHKVNMNIVLKPSTPLPAREVFTIGEIYVYPNFSLDQSDADTSNNEAVLFKGIHIIDKDNSYKPVVFSSSIISQTGQLYSKTEQNITISRLISLGTFKFVKTRFEQDKSSGESQLNTYYYLTQLPQKSLRGEVLGTTKSNNLTGSELSLSWRNRNTFHGAELFQIRGYGGFEVQVGGTRQSYNTYRIGVENTLSIPRFIVPFFELNTRNEFVPRTKFLLGYETLNKSKLYTLNSFRASAGYNWKENIRKEHELNIMSINYVQPANVTQKYLDSISNNIALGKTIEKQFILGSTYSITYTDQLEVEHKNNIYYNGNIDVAGNILGLIQGANYKTGDTATIFHARYSQYVKIDGDFRYYLKTGHSSSLACRIIAGFGYPYGNSSELPFIKQFFTGGTNSIRAFRARSVGPGTYHMYDSNTGNYLPDQSGDIKLELNAEYRIKLFSIVNGALFVDAGNTWLYNENPDKPGGKFSKEFLHELAVGTGAGLRFDLSFLVLRTDLAFPIRKPWLNKGERWVIDQIDFADSKWRKENLIFNLAIGYPF